MTPNTKGKPIAESKKNEKDKGTHEKKASDVSWVSAGFAFCALLVSVYSCTVSNEAQNLAERIYKQDRQLVLTGRFEEGGSSITLAPLDSEKKLMQGQAFLPKDLLEKPAFIQGDGTLRATGLLSFAIQQLADEKMEVEKDNVVIAEGDIPLIVKSHYISKGESYSDVSLYFLKIMVTITNTGHKTTNVRFQSLLFGHRMNPQEDVDLDYLEEIWVSKGVTIYPGSPGTN